MKRRDMRRSGNAVCFLICSLLCVAEPARSADGRLRFEHLTMDQGLSNNFIHSILKDSRGFL
ncbi:MAG: hypothetical protein JXO72_08715, partial [Vicinamibacteria bacterium]|nr:hypothetical protein [Vicinamibacteria bacterium]